MIFFRNEGEKVRNDIGEGLLLFLSPSWLDWNRFVCIFVVDK